MYRFDLYLTPKSNVQELASLSAGGGVRGLATDPAEICRIFRLSGESFLHLVSILDLILQVKLLISCILVFVVGSA